MNFKKDYINYVLYSVLQNSSKETAHFSPVLNDAINKTIAAEDLSQITFLIGKTAGFELLFKYILYVSDKIDKAQLSVANLKNNFEYDTDTLYKICRKIDSALTVQEKQLVSETGKEIPVTPEVKKEAIKIDLTEAAEVPYISEEVTTSDDITEEIADEPGMMLLENESESQESQDIYDLSEITESVEKAGAESEEQDKPETEIMSAAEYEVKPEEKITQEQKESFRDTAAPDESGKIAEKSAEQPQPEEKHSAGEETSSEERKDVLPEIEIEIKESFESEQDRGSRLLMKYITGSKINFLKK